jgi:magnesium transporter
MFTIFVHDSGRTRLAETFDPEWLRPDSRVVFWVDLSAPTPEHARILSDGFRFHELAVEDALSTTHHPKIEPYDGYVYLILHGIDFQEAQHRFATHDIDFFLGANYLVTVHDGTSRSVDRMRQVCPRNEQVLAEGSGALLYRIVDAMVDNYRPEVDRLEDRLDEIEGEVFERSRPELMRAILDLKRDVASLRRVTLPQRDAVGRLARREFPFVTEALSYRFRDVHDHLVRLADEATGFQDRITSLLDAHLSNMSNQLSQTMRVLTVIATVFMPLTLLTGLFGMNVELPSVLTSGPFGFWEIAGVMLAVCVTMLWMFRRRGWI